MLRRAIALLFVIPIMLAAASGASAAETVTKSHGASRFGDLKYGPGFKHFDYVNPDAPKGGTIRKALPGAFDSLNPYITKGQWSGATHYTYDTLMVGSQDEPDASYGLVAESLEYPEDLSWVIFNLRPEARWHDGEPITAEDVEFTFHTLVDKGKPLYKFYYANVEKVEVLGQHRIKFFFDQTGNRELPRIVGDMRIIPKHYWEGRDFQATTLDPPLGSGPYRITRVDPGRSLTLERVKDYWAKDLPVNVGQNNFDTIIWDYYRDDTVSFEAFKAGKVDYWDENTARNWATGYDFPAVKDGRVIKLTLPKHDEFGLTGFVYNLRKDKFSDPRVREALAYAWDFQWANENLFYGLYERTRSYFEGAPMAAKGLPSEAELKLLEPYRDQLPPRVFTEEYNPPVSDGSGRDRQNLRRATELLKAAGWEVRDGKLTNVKTGEVMTIQFFYVQSSSERIYSQFQQGLERLGVQVSQRQLDASEAIRRMQEFDFDLILSSRYLQTLSPGNEQREYFGSAAADNEGSYNIAGIKNPVIDALIEKIIFAEDRDSLITAARAMDRVLQWNFYTIPAYHSPEHRIGMWDRFGRPETLAKYALGLNYVSGFDDTWWIDPEKDAALKARNESAR